jgi:hypothetical protein
VQFWNKQQKEFKRMRWKRWKRWKRWTCELYEQYRLAGLRGSLITYTLQDVGASHNFRL